MVKINVRGGTSQTKEDLCNTCTYRIYVKGFNNIEVKDCKAQGFTETSGWPFAVSECSLYQHTKHISLFELKEIAWHITPEVKERVGFKSPETTVKVVKPGEKGHNQDNTPDWE